MMDVKTKVAALLRGRPTKALIDDLVATNRVNDVNIPMVRGWLLDELERRDPEAFSAWIDGDAEDDGLYAAYGV